jgi:histidine triad (HIT) family protein
MRFVYNGTNPAEKTLGALRLRRVGDRVYHRNFPISKILSMSEKSVFTRIIEGEIPCYKVYEDEHVIAFLDINPIALGHTLVVPKVQIDHFDEVPEPYYSAVWAAVKKLSPVLSSAMGTKRTGVIVAGFDVPHAHIHLVPAYETSDMNPANARKREDVEMREVLEKITKLL